MIIVIESPHKAPALKRALRANQVEAKVIATYGRLFDLPSSNMGITKSLGVERFEAVNPDHCKSISEDLMAADLVVATDPDEEGDLIAWTIGQIRGDRKTYRAEMFDFTPKSVSSALENLRIVSSAEPPALTRRIFDRLLGFSGNDGMFLSRTAGVLLGSAAGSPLPTTKRTSLTHNQENFGEAAFLEQYFDVYDNEVSFNHEKPGDLPKLRHLYALGPELGATPTETFEALQELYISDDISYFRTDSMSLNNSAHDALEILADESGFENQCQKKPWSNRAPHPGIYVTRYVDSHPRRGRALGRRSELAQTLHRFICNATLFAMSDQKSRTNVRVVKGGKAYTSTIAECRGQTYSYPYSTFSLSTDILEGAPRVPPRSHSLPINKETSIALTLSGQGIGHPSSWAALSKNYSPLIDRNGRLSSRGVAFLHKHKLEAPALLEPNIARAIEATLLDPQPEMAVKIEKALKLAELDLSKFENSLTPDPSPNAELQFSDRTLGL